ncbi:MAG: EamA family transporter [Bacteroidales bacterium]|nr:EamA family transporter [Bacteroidales bacterium]
MAPEKKHRSVYYAATLAGILAVLLWASNIAFSKSVFESQGYMNGAFLIYFYSGLFMAVLFLLFNRKTNFIKSFISLPIRYYFKTGLLFVINNVLLFVAIGMAGKNEELIIVTLLNYTWPVLIYILRIPMFRARVSMLVFLPGLLLSLAGITLAVLQGNSHDDITALLKAGDDNVIAYLLVFMAALSWALYSNLTVKHVSSNDMAGIPVVFLISSLVFLIIQAVGGNLASVQLHAIVTSPDLLYTVAGPTTLGYFTWYIAMKWGNKILVTSVSFFIPLFSLVFLWMKFHLEIRLMFWVAALLLISGSAMCYKAFRNSA